jgi:hypothetical protein
LTVNVCAVVELTFFTVTVVPSDTVKVVGLNTSAPLAPCVSVAVPPPEFVAGGDVVCVVGGGCVVAGALVAGGVLAFPLEHAASSTAASSGAASARA